VDTSAARTCRRAVGSGAHHEDPYLIANWNADPTPIVWTATTNEILATVRLVQTNIKRLVDNRAK